MLFLLLHVLKMSLFFFLFLKDSNSSDTAVLIDLSTGPVSYRDIVHSVERTTWVSESVLAFK